MLLAAMVDVFCQQSLPGSLKRRPSRKILVINSRFGATSRLPVNREAFATRELLSKDLQR